MIKVSEDIFFNMTVNFNMLHKSHYNLNSKKEQFLLGK